jgi:tripeptide aminopeptidase
MHIEQHLPQKRRSQSPKKQGMKMNRLLDRFCRYVRIDTEANEASKTVPSTPGQLELGKLLTEELKALGLADAVQDEFGIVMATIPATIKHPAPTIAWIAHVDTTPETSGKNVNPIVHANYDGGDIVLPGDKTKVLRVAENPELAALKGKTIITTDGTTLLGSDDKAGVAVIMEATAELLARPEILHGPIRVCFTCDEEIGRGVDHLNLKKLGATVAYTLDGGGVGDIDNETFSADLAVVTITGTNTHPGTAKGRMVNAIRLAGLFLDRLPRTGQSPETTEEREGFLHPYRLEGGVAEVTLRILLRDFDTNKLAERAEMLRTTAKTVTAEYPSARIEVAVNSQYRNMAEGLGKEPRVVPLAQEAMRRAGVVPKLAIVRGGTDGSRLTEMGLPTPNLSTGEHNIHSPLEWTCLEEMATAVRVLLELAKVWGTEKP